jgi:hypothetical protein
VSALLTLADRCEAATGPDRELDVEIVYGLYPDIGNYAGQCIGDDPIFWHEPYRKQPCPHFTASLDAAMTLVPEGLDFGCGRGIDTELGANKAVCHAWVGEGEGDLVFAETVALALCAAALKARAAQGDAS